MLKRLCSYFNSIQIVLAVLFIGLGFFASVKSVQAACNYDILRFDASGIRAASPGDTLHFIATVERSGTLKDCDVDDYTIYLRTKDGVREIAKGKLSFVASNSKSQGNVTFNYYLGNVDRSILPVTNQMSFYFGLLGYQNYAGEPSAALVPFKYSDDWVVNISGGGTSQGGAIKVSFKPEKGEYSKDEKIQVHFYMPAADVDNIDKSVTSIYMATYVNGTKIAGYAFNKSTLRTQTVYQDNVVINAASGFKNGLNNIEVKLFQTDTNLYLASGTATLQAKGLPEAATPPSGNSSSNPGGNASSTQPKATDTLYNPLPTDDLVDMVLRIMKYALGLLGGLAVVYIIIGGFQMVISQGNSEAYESAKKTITWAIMGMIVALLSFSIVAIVQNVLQVDIKPVDQTTQNK